MEPKLSSPESSPQYQPPSPEQYIDSEPSIEVPQRAPESAPERGGEQLSAVSSPTQPTPDPSLITLPTPVALQGQADDATISDDLPQAAADDDLIEKEWVDKAKKIISETRDDPHKQEREVGKLQADYLRKRYGKELGAS